MTEKERLGMALYWAAFNLYHAGGITIEEFTQIQSMTSKVVFSK